MLRGVWSFHACVRCQMVECGPAYASQTGREQRSPRCWQRRPRRLNPHYHPLIIALFLFFFFFFLSDILMAAVACNYVAIICFLASNWCSNRCNAKSDYVYYTPAGTGSSLGVARGYLTEDASNV